ncbi:hypothetical protein SCIP_1410 [Scardovia inopinata JCM 12537]|nr:hypothetical protein SCIP_1410 [Scardovia inopinata JCM 12537]
MGKKKPDLRTSRAIREKERRKVSIIKSGYLLANIALVVIIKDSNP